MRIHFLILAAVILFTSSPTFGDEVRQVFDSLYGPRIKQAITSIDKADDIALAGSLLEAAQSSSDTPALVALLCDASHSLAHRHAEGYATAAQAMELLAKLVPDQRDAAREKLLAVMMLQTRTGKAEDRDLAFAKVIEALIAIGDEKIAAKQWPDATANYRRALSVATTKKSPRLEDIKSRVEESMRIERVSKQIARLQEKLLEDANDFATAEEIVRLLIIELDDADAAVPMLSRVKSESLKKIVPLAGKALGDLNAEEALALGEWYRAQAAASAPANRELWLKTEQTLGRFLELNTDSGITFTKASVMYTEAKGKMDSLKAVAKPAPAARLPRNPLIAEDKHFGFTGFQKENNLYTLTAAGPIPASRTKLRYKGHTDGGPHSFGHIHVRLDGRDWVKVGEWSDVSLVESSKNDHWTTIDLTALPVNVNAKKMEVKFEFTKGGWRMQIYEVQWTTK